MTNPSAPVNLSLDPPSSFVFTVRECTGAFRLNQFAIGLKQSENRERFLADERSAMMAAGLSETEMEMVAARDWTGLIASGGHVLAIVKIAYSLGVLHHEVGAHMCGLEYQELREQLPRNVDLLPRDLEPEAGT